ncbi:MAG: ABC transporter ATP-binding protein [Planctomycetota bacterium]
MTDPQDTAGSSTESSTSPDATASAAASSTLPTPGDVIYSVERVRKEYRMQGLVVPVLKGIDLEIFSGEILSIIGLSGVGKSTLLNLMGLLDQPTEGKLVYRGRDAEFRDRDLGQLNLKEKSRIRNREFGFVFQFYHLLPDLSVKENVLLPAMILRSTGEYRKRRAELDKRASELLDRVGILDRADFPPSRLSGGERQRCAIARALMNDPELVFCDEPTGNLDTATGQRIHELILELNREIRTAFVIVTHDQNLAALAHRQLAMRDGLFDTPDA